MKNESGFYPTGDLVLVRPLEVAETTDGGIVLSKVTIDKEGLAARIGHVVEMGNLARRDARMEGIEIGDMVLFARYSGDFWPVDGVKYIICRAALILGKVDKLPDYMLNAARSQIEMFGANTPGLS